MSADFKSVDAKALANLILDWGDADAVEISPMKLQKLIFFPHADFLLAHDFPLIKQEFEAWDYGPVLPGVYQEFKVSRSRPITTRATVFDPFSLTRQQSRAELSPGCLDKFRSLYDFYKNLSAGDLSHISHSYDGVWRQARSLFANGLNMDRRMSNELIRKFHRPLHA